MARLDEYEIEHALADLPGWRRDGKAIVRTVQRVDFRDAVAFIGAIATEAERADHHPDLCLRRYRSVEIRLTSHEDGGITDRDIALARVIEGLASA